MRKFIIGAVLLLAALTCGTEKAQAAPPSGYDYCVWSIGAVGGLVPAIIYNCHSNSGWSGWIFYTYL